MTLEDLLNLLQKYNYSEDEIKKIEYAYQYADLKHGNQVRQSGEPYITHPLHVAYTLVGLHADVNTIIAALLHDVGKPDAKTTDVNGQDHFKGHAMVSEGIAE